jgi:hypothetical protein
MNNLNQREQKAFERAVQKEWEGGRSEGKQNMLEELTGLTGDYQASDEGEPPQGELFNN